jgi:hypothetical protein
MLELISGARSCPETVQAAGKASHRTPSDQPSSRAIEKKVDAAAALLSRGLPRQREQNPRFSGKSGGTTLPR